jgi:hypothetical protein
MALPTFRVESVFVATWRANSAFQTQKARRLPNLSKNIVHFFACFGIAFAKDGEQSQNLDLEEGICDTRNIVFWAVSGRH